MTGSISLVDYAAQTPDDMRAGLVQQITNESVFLRILRFIPVNGMTYSYGKQITLGSIAFRGINESYTADTGVVNPEIETLAVFGGLIGTDYQLAVSGPARTNAILAKTRKAGLFFDKYCIDGDPAVIVKSFYGLKTRLAGNQLLYPAADASNGGVLALGDVDRLLDAVVGPNSKKTLVMCKADRRKIKQLVVAAAGGASVTDVGKELPNYDGATIEVLDEDGDEAPIITKNETRGSSNLTSSMYCIRPGDDSEGDMVQGLVKMGGPLQGIVAPGFPVDTSGPVVHVPQGVQGTKVQDLIEMCGGLGVFHGRAAARLAGIL